MRKLWLIFIGIFVFSFAVLGWVGTEIYRQKPPIPREVVMTNGQVLIPAEEIQNGQNVWQAMGGMQVGSIWGHGSYVAPDWSADYLHREAVFILNEWSNGDFGKSYNQLNSEQQAVLRQRLQDTVRKNNYDEATGKLRKSQTLFRHFYQRKQGIRNSARRAIGRDQIKTIKLVFLLDGVGFRRQSPERHHFIYK